VTELRTVTFKLDEYTVNKLDAIARAKGVTRSDIIREAIMRYLDEEEKKLVPRYEPEIRPKPKYVLLTS